jgi:hypothetical protein
MIQYILSELYRWSEFSHPDGLTPNDEHFAYSQVNEVKFRINVLPGLYSR